MPAMLTSHVGGLACAQPRVYLLYSLNPLLSRHSLAVAAVNSKVFSFPATSPAFFQINFLPPRERSSDRQGGVFSASFVVFTDVQPHISSVHGLSLADLALRSCRALRRTLWLPETSPNQSIHTPNASGHLGGSCSTAVPESPYSSPVQHAVEVLSRIEQAVTTIVVNRQPREGVVGSLLPVSAFRLLHMWPAHCTGCTVSRLMVALGEEYVTRPLVLQSPSVSLGMHVARSMLVRAGGHETRRQPWLETTSAITEREKDQRETTQGTPTTPSTRSAAAVPLLRFCLWSHFVCCCQYGCPWPF